MLNSENLVKSCVLACSLVIEWNCIFQMWIGPMSHCFDIFHVYKQDRYADMHTYATVYEEKVKDKGFLKIKFSCSFNKCPLFNNPKNYFGVGLSKRYTN